MVLAISLLGIAALLAVFRMIVGPTVVDRMVALDIATTITAAALFLVAFHFGRFIYADVALVYAAISFAAVVALGRFLEERGEA
ncbi:cation:proton antiporter [Coprothermobacteraceae bacterium]|nr:cation:proton antiporter [Coprothermobacteraceae bacterium]